MSWTASSPISASAVLLALAGCASQPATRTLLYADDFSSTQNWIVEAEQPARVRATGGALDIDTPAGCTVWLKTRLEGPVEIEFDATAVSQGGPNDQVSDLNVFWMAANRDGSAPFALQRNGAFAGYNNLLTYYVGLGGNRNTTTRFRRYIGDPDLRPLLPEHDLGTPDALLVPNRRQTITLVAHGSHIEYRRDGRTLFTYEDPAPYVQGWFAFRTTYSHLRIERLRVYTLKKASNSR
jgi:hypothetical protein